MDSPPPAPQRGHHRKLRIAIQVLVSGGILAYLLWRIDLGETADLIASSSPGYLLAAVALFVGTTWGMAWRWQALLDSKGIREPLAWLTKLYFVSYAVGQVLPTAVGGDAVRIVEHARRRPDAKAEAAAAVLMERVIGAAGTLVVVAIGLAIAAGRYEDVRFVAWVEVALVLATIVFLALVFSRRTGRHLQERVFPLGRRLRLERPVTSLYVAMHEYRARPSVLLFVLAMTIVTQLARVVGIWFCGEAVGIDVSPLVYFVLGPLLFLVQMAPFTLNGLGVREAFFVEFLARFDVPADAAFAAGVLYYAVLLATSLPGAFILLWRSVRPARRVQQET
jgi:glycosyltransferase 2 family protein